MSVGCLPWYVLPETESAQDALWSMLARNLSRVGIDAPNMLCGEVPVQSIFCNPISFSLSALAKHCLWHRYKPEFARHALLLWTRLRWADLPELRTRPRRLSGTAL